MNFFFEILDKKIGYSRRGRINLSKDAKNYIHTPNILIPMKSLLMNHLNFLEFFEKHEVFKISKDIYLKISFLREKFRNVGFVYIHSGTLENFQEIIHENIEIFSEENVLPIIPFNNPTTSVSKGFAENEITIYLERVSKILKLYPKLRLGLSIRIFDYPELFQMYFSLIENNVNIVFLNLVDLFDNFTNFRKIIKIISEIKQEFDNNLILMASGRILPKHYPILIYLGIDLIDSSFLLYISSENFYDTIEYLLPLYKLKELPCSCIACKGNLKNILGQKDSTEKTEQLILHNLISSKVYMNKINQYLKTEDYRAFVEKSSLDDINIVSILKLLDKEYYNNIKYETPLAQESKVVKSFGPSSYFRPDFREFRERVISNFEAEPWTKLILLLPCSSTKPYSESKSHKKFHNIIRKFPDFPDFQEIILTSPLGAIPRQLENIYPVNSYDISVTGDWDEEEITIASNMLVKLINKYNSNIPVITHLPEGDYQEIVKRALQNLDNEFYFTNIQRNLTSSGSLKSLEELINKLKDQYFPHVQISTNLLKTWTRKFVKIADYQFWEGFGVQLFSEGIKTKRNKINSQIGIFNMNDNKLIGKFLPKTGQLELTLKGVEKVSPHDITSNFLVFNGINITGNTLFRPGVVEYSPHLRPMDHVFILDEYKNEIIGLGQMIVGSKYLEKSKTGRVANIYEKIK